MRSRRMVRGMALAGAGMILLVASPVPPGSAQQPQQQQQPQSQQPPQQQARVERLEILEAGLYTARLTGRTTAAPGGSGGVIRAANDVRFLTDATAVTAGTGMGIGVRFRTVGRATSAVARLRSVWKIPSPGIVNPTNGNTYRTSVVDFTAAIGVEDTRGYGFDAPWEVVPGEWTLQIFQGDRLLLEQTFQVR
jgi:hypothetical protein